MFFSGICRTRMLYQWLLHDLEVKTLISALDLSLSDLCFIVKSKMAVILHICNKNHDVIRNVRYIKAN